MTMFQPNSNTQFIHINPSASDDMSIEIQNEGEQNDDSPQAAKRTRTSSSLSFEENAITMTTDMSTDSICQYIETSPNPSEGVTDDDIATEPSPEHTIDLDIIVDKFKDNIHQMYDMDQLLFGRTMKQLENNYKLLDLLLWVHNQEDTDNRNSSNDNESNMDETRMVTDFNETNNDETSNDETNFDESYSELYDTGPFCQFTSPTDTDDDKSNEQSSNAEICDEPSNEYVMDVVSILEHDCHDEFEIEFMVRIVAKEHINAADVHSKMVEGHSIAIAENDKSYKRIIDHEQFMNSFVDENTKFSLVSNYIDQYKINQLRMSEFYLLLHMIQSDEIRNNPNWNHSVDDMYYISKDSKKNHVTMNNVTFNRDCREALITIKEYNDYPKDFMVQGRYLIQKDTMLRIRLYHDELKQNNPWFGNDINVMKIRGMKNDTIFVENLQIETRLKEETLY